MQYPCDSADQRLWFLMHAAPVTHAGGGAVISHTDITAWAGAGLQRTNP
jgi:two-component system CheB/CheR fusion protein